MTTTILPELAERIIIDAICKNEDDVRVKGDETDAQVKDLRKGMLDAGEEAYLSVTVAGSDLMERVDKLVSKRDQLKEETDPGFDDAAEEEYNRSAQEIKVTFLQRIESIEKKRDDTIAAARDSIRSLRAEEKEYTTMKIKHHDSLEQVLENLTWNLNQHAKKR